MICRYNQGLNRLVISRLAQHKFSNKCMLKCNYQVKMLSFASKGRNHIAMMSNNSRVILRCIMTSFNVMLLSDDVTYQFVLYSVVSKHLLLALSVLCLYCGINI